MTREFESGATRDTDVGKLDFEGFFAPTVLLRYSEYMNRHRQMPDGTLRDSDNWQKGIPIDVYRKSLVRHLMQAWSLWRGNVTVDNTGAEIDMEEALCAILFNVQGLLFEELKRKHGSRVRQ